MIGVSRSTISKGGNQRASRVSSRVSRFRGPVNSSAHTPVSDASASISPSGVLIYARASCILQRSSLTTFDEVPDDRALFLHELRDPVVGKIQQRHQRVAAEGQGLGRPLNLDEAIIAGFHD